MQFNNTNQNIKVVNPDKPFCMQCGVNLSERTEIIKSGMKIYQECPKCHKQWIIECDIEGNVVSTKVIECK